MQPVGRSLSIGEQVRALKANQALKQRMLKMYKEDLPLGPVDLNDFVASNIPAIPPGSCITNLLTFADPPTSYMTMPRAEMNKSVRPAYKQSVRKTRHVYLRKIST